MCFRVKKALTAEHKAPEGGDGHGQLDCLSPFHPLINTCISSGVLRFVYVCMSRLGGEKKARFKDGCLCVFTNTSHLHIDSELCCETFHLEITSEMYHIGVPEAKIELQSAAISFNDFF